MTALVTVLDAADLPVGSGVSVDSARWDDTGLAVSPTPTVAVAHAGTGQWLVTASDPATPRGGMTVLLAYDDGIEAVKVPVPVLDLRLAASAITDAAFGWNATDAAGLPSTVTGRLRRFINRWFHKRMKNRTTKVETQFASDGTTPLHELNTSSAVVGGETIDTVTASAVTP